MKTRFRSALHIILFLLVPFFAFCIEGEWISIEDEDELDGVRIIFLFHKNTLSTKEIKTAIESPIINNETHYTKENEGLFVNKNDSIYIIKSTKRNELLLKHHKYGELRLSPFKRSKQSKNIEEIKELLLNNLIKIKYNEKDYFYDINRDSICVDSSMSIFGQLYYIEIFDEEVFLVLTRMFGPIYHIVKYDEDRIVTRMYNGKFPREIVLELQPEFNQNIREVLQGTWESTRLMGNKSTVNLDCQSIKDTISFSDNKCYFNTSCYITNGLWDVCHNGKFIAFREWSSKYNSYQMPEKLKLKLLNEETLEIETFYVENRSEVSIIRTFEKIKND